MMTATTELRVPERYVFVNEWEHAQRRLRLLEQSFDAGTIRRLQAAGVEPGWRCLEAGGGAGSITQWLCSQVGPDGRVLAVDLDTRFLDQLDELNLDVQRVDLRTDELPRDSFDLIHARALLMHIPQRQEILDKLKAAPCRRSSGGCPWPRSASWSKRKESARSRSISGIASSVSRVVGSRAWRSSGPADAVTAEG